MFTEWFIGLGNSIFIYATACIALFFFGIWWYRKKDSAFALFASTLLLWVLSYSLDLISSPASIFSALALAGWSTLNTLFCFHLFQDRPSRLFMAMLGICAALIVAGHAAGMPQTSMLVALPGAVSLSLLLRPSPVANLTLDENPKLLILLSSMIVLAYPFADSVFYWPLGSVMYIGIALILTSRFADALSQWENLNSILQSRVNLERKKIEQQYSRLIDLEKVNATMQERQRIFQDLHDDIGARLLTIVHMSETEKDQTLARKALQELRDIVSIKSRSSLSLPDAMADICTQSQHALENAGRELNWIQNEDIPDYPFSESFLILLKRAIRQSIALWIASTRAGQLTISIKTMEDHLQINISDLGTSCIDTILQNFQQPLARYEGSIQLDNDLTISIPIAHEQDPVHTHIAV